MRLKSSSLILLLILPLYVACGGGSSSNGNVSIDGAFGRATSTPVAKEFSADGAVPVAGVEICCSGSCDLTEENGSFRLNFGMPNDGIECTVNGGDFVNDSFVIAEILAPGTYIVQITALERGDDVGFGFALDVELDSSTPVCGNGVAEGGNGEDCDGSDLAGGDCFSAGFSTGTLSCNSDCSYNTSECVLNESPICGDGVIEGGEECDGENITDTCTDLGFEGGELSCNSDCLLDASECTNVSQAPECGNDLAEGGGGEECDGSDLAGQSCASLGEGTGTLTCTSDCTFNISGCSGTNGGCSQSEMICSNSGQAPECTACQCDDGFNIGSCDSICADTMQAPTICSGEMLCTDGSDPICPN